MFIPTWADRLLSVHLSAHTAYSSAPGRTRTDANPGLEGNCSGGGKEQVVTFRAVCKPDPPAPAYPDVRARDLEMFIKSAFADAD